MSVFESACLHLINPSPTSAVSSCSSPLSRIMKPPPHLITSIADPTGTDCYIRCSHLGPTWLVISYFILPGWSQFESPWVHMGSASGSFLLSAFCTLRGAAALSPSLRCSGHTWPENTRAVGAYSGPAPARSWCARASSSTSQLRVGVATRGLASKSSQPALGLPLMLLLGCMPCLWLAIPELHLQSGLRLPPVRVLVMHSS